jgi:metallophosphoesterase (TIGR00282 family)
LLGYNLKKRLGESVKIAFCADVVGRPGREMLKSHIEWVKREFGVDIVVVNYENISHGFGMSAKNAKELFKLPIDVMSGGNHSWDKRDLIPLMEEMPILRPVNYPKTTPGKGVWITDTKGEKLAVVNLMGYFTMPMVDNPFTKILEVVEELEEEGIKRIFIDFHAEATAEKRALLMLLKGRVSAICGSHTHVGTDDLVIDSGTFYVSDVGLTGCRDNSLGMDTKEVLDKCLNGVSGKFDVPKRCKKIFQCVIFELDEDGKCIEAFKLKAYDEDRAKVVQRAYVEE